MPRGKKGTGPFSRNAKEAARLQLDEPVLMQAAAPSNGKYIPSMRVRGFYEDPAKALHAEVQQLFKNANGREVHIIGTGLTNIVDIVVMTSPLEQLTTGDRTLITQSGAGLIDTLVAANTQLYAKVNKP